MNRIRLGLAWGAALGICDSLSAWFTPVARIRMLGMVVSSVGKGIAAGALIGWFECKVDSLALGILFGSGVSLTLSFVVASVEHSDYFQSLLVGGIAGLIIASVTHRYGSARKT